MILAIGLACAGCASDTPMNPSFPLTRDVAAAALKQMQRDQRALPRPVIVLGGIHDPGFVAPHIADVIRDSVPDRTLVMDVSFFETGSFEKCGAKLIRMIDERFPSDDPSHTIEVDVVAFSMGGLVARLAASDAWADTHGRRLRMTRLFTISTPHQGADLAGLPTLDDRVKSMREGSAFLEQLNSGDMAIDNAANGDDASIDKHETDASANENAADQMLIVMPVEGAARHGYRLFAYVRLNDGVIGEEHAAPLGVNAWWVPNGLSFSHLLAGFDNRILADILRRLREEEPYSIEPAAPLPAKK
jgi:hypothetical protein